MPRAADDRHSSKLPRPHPAPLTFTGGDDPSANNVPETHT
jgi:hypothetical protein